MIKQHYVVALALMVLLAALPGTMLAQDASTVLNNVAKEMGADNLKTLQYSGSGSNAGIGQNRNPNLAWPLVRMKSYTRQIDFDATASHVQLVRVQNNADQTQNQNISSSSPWAQQYDFWITPHGFLKGARANNATLASETLWGIPYQTLTYTLPGNHKVKGFINDKNLVEKVHVWVDNPVLGDMLVEGVYRDYEDFGGVKFPTMVIQNQGGYPVLILVVSDVKPNVPVNMPAPQQTQAPAAPQPVSVMTEKVAEGVFYLRGGSHHSVAVEFADHVAVIEAPQNEQRSLAVIAEVKKQIPNKPIRYIVNTHHHFDHSGGLRTYVDEGAIVVTHEINREFYAKVLTGPRTLTPDRLTQSGKAPRFETVGEKKVLSDATRTLELHLIKDNAHNDGILMAYLPAEKIIVAVDVYTPPAANAAPPATPNPNTVNFVENLERLKLDFDKVLALHGPGVSTKADLYRVAGKAAAGE